jgi:hypothetical protein
MIAADGGSRTSQGPAHQDQAGQPKQASQGAVAAVLLGLAGLIITLPVDAFPVPFLALLPVGVSGGAVVCGVRGLRQVRPSGGKGRGLAIAGFVLGVLSLAASLAIGIYATIYFSNPANNVFS